MSILGEGELAEIEVASSLLRMGLPSKMEEVKLRTFCTKIIACEDALANMRYQLSLIYSVEWHKFKNYEAKRWRELREDEEYSPADTKYYLYKDNVYNDMSTKCEHYKATLDRVDSLVWQLKELLKVATL